MHSSMVIEWSNPRKAYWLIYANFVLIIGAFAVRGIDTGIEFAAAVGVLVLFTIHHTGSWPVVKEGEN